MNQETDQAAISQAQVTWLISMTTEEHWRLKAAASVTQIRLLDVECVP